MTTEFESLYDEESGRTLGVLLNQTSLGRKNELFNVTAFWRAFTASWRQKGKRKQIFPRAVRTTKLPSNPSPLTFRNNQIQILQTSSTHATMAANVFQQDTNTHGTRLSHARTRQSFFDTTHKKWSEWKTNRSGVITGRFRRERQSWGVSKTK